MSDLDVFTQCSICKQSVKKKNLKSHIRRAHHGKNVQVRNKDLAPKLTLNEIEAMFKAGKISQQTRHRLKMELKGIPCPHKYSDGLNMGYATSRPSKSGVYKSGYTKIVNGFK